MSYVVTVAQLSAFVPSMSADVANSLVPAINAAMAKFQIDQQQRRVRYFMAQTAFESENFTSWAEDLDYTTAERLVEVWPDRFTMDPNNTSLSFAPAFTNNPQALANLVYASRDGNGDPASGDGWTFHGRGAIQITGRDNYTAYDKAVYGDGHIIANPDLVIQPTDAFMSAGWFWSSNGLNALADSDKFTDATQVINGSTDTVDERIPYLNSANTTFTW
jgi:putative chitinase